MAIIKSHNSDIDPIFHVVKISLTYRGFLLSVCYNRERFPIKWWRSECRKRYQSIHHSIWELAVFADYQWQSRHNGSWCHQLNHPLPAYHVWLQIFVMLDGTYSAFGLFLVTQVCFSLAQEMTALRKRKKCPGWTHNCLYPQRSLHLNIL